MHLRSFTPAELHSNRKYSKYLHTCHWTHFKYPKSVFQLHIIWPEKNMCGQMILDFFLSFRKISRHECEVETSKGCVSAGFYDLLKHATHSESNNPVGYCCNLSVGVALNVWFTTNGMCAKNNIHIYVARTSDCGAWSLLLLAATVWSFAHLPLGISDRNTTFRAHFELRSRQSREKILDE